MPRRTGLLLHLPVIIVAAATGYQRCCRRGAAEQAAGRGKPHRYPLVGGPSVRALDPTGKWNGSDFVSVVRDGRVRARRQAARGRWLEHFSRVRHTGACRKRSSCVCLDASLHPDGPAVLVSGEVVELVLADVALAADTENDVDVVARARRPLHAPSTRSSRRAFNARLRQVATIGAPFDRGRGQRAGVRARP
jgi:hypothetical protein